MKMRMQAQQGYAMLAFVVFLLGMGGGVLSYMPSLGVVASAQSATKDQHALIAARQSLLSYAALYPYLYGPTGAGPAHLPCPDTDSQGSVGAQNTSSVGVRRDGPNPPCANPVVSEGKLPRHTVLPGNRYLFHAEPYQRIDYAVSGAFVNNPLNRLLNLSNLNQVRSKPVSMLSVISADGSRTKARVTITSEALAASVAPAVALWLTQRINTQVERYCTEPLVSEGVLASPSLAIQDETISCSDLFVDPEEHCSTSRLLALLLDQPLVSGESCLIDVLAENTLEGVSANRQWFLRNNWHLSVNVQHADDCLPSDMLLIACRLESVGSSTPSLGHASGTGIQTEPVFLEFRWVPAL